MHLASKKNQYSDQHSKLIIGFETDIDYHLVIQYYFMATQVSFARYIDSDSF